jgi:hypothetical protein
MKFLKNLLLAALIGFATPVAAQWQVPQYSIPAGRGGGQTGFNFLSPGTAGNVLTSKGASALPAFLPPVDGLNAVAFGADPTGASDSTAAFNAAVAALGTNHCGAIYFPAGKYRFNSALSVTLGGSKCSLTIAGVGQDASTLYWPNASGGLTIDYGTDYSNSAHVRGLSFTTGTTNGGLALRFYMSVAIANPANTAISDVYSVTIRGDDGYEVTNYWSTGLTLDNVSNAQVENLTVVGAAAIGGNGILIQGKPSSATYAVALNVAKSTFLGLTSGLVYGSYVQGVTIDQTNFTAVVQGIIVPGANTGVEQQLSITNSQFNASLGGIIAGVTIGNAQINNNLIFVPTNGVGIFMPASNAVITNNQIICGTTTNSTGISLTSGGGAVISNNFIAICNVGITLASGTALVRTSHNLTSNVTNYIDAGTNNTREEWEGAQLTITGTTIKTNANLGIGSPATIFAPLHTKVATDENLLVRDFGGLNLAAVNDANNANASMRFDASSYLFAIGPATFNGNLTVNPPNNTDGVVAIFRNTGTLGAYVALDNATGSQQVGHQLRENGTNKWFVGKNANQDFLLYDYIAGASIMQAPSNGSTIQFGRAITPITTGVSDLGTTSLMWGNLFLKSGGIVNFNNGNYTLTHSAGLLSASGPFSSVTGFRVNNLAATGTILRGDGTNFIASAFTLPASVATGDLWYGSGTNALSALADVATGNALISGGVGTAPSWGKIGLTTHVSGTLGVGNGGTGITSGTSGGVLGFTASGTLASSVALTANAIVLGGGAGATPTPLGSLGTTTTVLHGNAGGAPSFGAVVSADLSITTTSCTNQFVTAISSGAVGTCTTDTLASAQHANQGTTTTLLHGNGAGNPSWAAVVSADLNITVTTCTNQFVTAISASAAGTCTTSTLASAQFANQGTTTTVLHGNGGGNPSWGAVSLTADITGTLGLANGGTNANLSGTGGTSQVLRQSSAGAAVTVSQLSFSDISGVVGPTQGARTKLTGTFTYGVSTTGTDQASCTATSGLTGAAACATIQYVVNYINSSIDIAGQTIVIQLGDGTYTNTNGGMNWNASTTGGGTVYIAGNAGALTNVVISTTSIDALLWSVPSSTLFVVQNLRLQTTTAGSGINVAAAVTVNFKGVDFAATAAAHISVGTFGTGKATGNYTISGGATWHAITSQGFIQLNNFTITLSGTPAFGQFLYSTRLGFLWAEGVTWAGTGATGPRFNQDTNAVIYTGNACGSVPGTAAGSTGVCN